MDKTTDTITNCPAHLEPALAAARLRWAGYVGDHRAQQAAEVLEHASALLLSRSWDTAGGEIHAELGAWLAQTAMSEESARIAAEAAAPKASDLGTLTADEIALVLAARKGGK